MKNRRDALYIRKGRLVGREKEGTIESDAIKAWKKGGKDKKEVERGRIDRKRTKKGNRNSGGKKGGQDGENLSQN